jgi:hypothetical protein
VWQRPETARHHSAHFFVPAATGASVIASASV